jgi:2-polyprenyl-3-methyl-5-hydroxy-6-metoxy-1,4-benzoquinol methylase
MKCKACGSTKIESYNLCKSTVAGYRCNTIDESLEAPVFDLVLDYCTECSLVSQRSYREANALLNKLYEEHASTQHSENNPYFQKLAERLISDFFLSKGSKILEVGCNCGALLKILRDKSGADVYGVEPSKAMKEIWQERKLQIVNGYLNSETANIVEKFGPFDLIYFRHVFEHIPDPVEFIKLVSGLLAKDGVIALEVPYLASIFDLGRVENVGYSHLNHYCIRSLDVIFKQFGMGLIAHTLEVTDGGSIVAYFKKGELTPKHLLENAMQEKIIKFIQYNKNIREFVTLKLKTYKNGQLIGYGAGAKGQHLIHLLGLDRYISEVIDDTPGFNGKFIPGTGIRIISRDVWDKSNTKAIINLAPTHTEIIKKNIPVGMEFLDFVNSIT